jgi:hypothetical protein
MSRFTRIGLALAIVVTTLTGRAFAGEPGLVDPYQDEDDGLVDPYEGRGDPHPRRIAAATVDGGLVDPYQDEDEGLVDPDQDRVDPYLEWLLPDMRALQKRPRY